MSSGDDSSDERLDDHDGENEVFSADEDGKDPASSQLSAFFVHGKQVLKVLKETIAKKSKHARDITDESDVVDKTFSYIQEVLAILQQDNVKKVSKNRGFLDLLLLILIDFDRLGNLIEEDEELLFRIWKSYIVILKDFQHMIPIDNVTRITIILGNHFEDHMMQIFEIYNVSSGLSTPAPNPCLAKRIQHHLQAIVFFSQRIAATLAFYSFNLTIHLCAYCFQCLCSFRGFLVLKAHEAEELVSVTQLFDELFKKILTSSPVLQKHPLLPHTIIYKAFTTLHSEWTQDFTLIDNITSTAPLDDNIRNINATLFNEYYNYTNIINANIGIAHYSVREMELAILRTFGCTTDSEQGLKESSLTDEEMDTAAGECASLALDQFILAIGNMCIAYAGYANDGVVKKLIITAISAVNNLLRSVTDYKSADNVVSVVLKYCCKSDSDAYSNIARFILNSIVKSSSLNYQRHIATNVWVLFRKLCNNTNNILTDDLLGGVSMTIRSLCLTLDEQPALHLLGLFEKDVNNLTYETIHNLQNPHNSRHWTDSTPPLSLYALETLTMKLPLKQLYSRVGKSEVRSFVEKLICKSFESVCRVCSNTNETSVTTVLPSLAILSISSFSRSTRIPIAEINSAADFVNVINKANNLSFDRVILSYMTIFFGYVNLLTESQYLEQTNLNKLYNIIKSATMLQRSLLVQSKATVTLAAKLTYYITASCIKIMSFAGKGFISDKLPRAEKNSKKHRLAQANDQGITNNLSVDEAPKMVQEKVMQMFHCACSLIKDISITPNLDQNLTSEALSYVSQSFGNMSRVAEMTGALVWMLWTTLLSTIIVFSDRLPSHYKVKVKSLVPESLWPLLQARKQKLTCTTHKNEDKDMLVDISVIQASLLSRKMLCMAANGVYGAVAKDQGTRAINVNMDRDAPNSRGKKRQKHSHGAYSPISRTSSITSGNLSQQ